MILVFSKKHPKANLSDNMTAIRRLLIGPMYVRELDDA